MTDAPARKPNRAGLFGPFVAVLFVAAGWSAYWVYTAHIVEGALQAQQAGLVAQGYKVSSEPYHVGGYPYRVSVVFKNLSVIAPSGRGVTFPVLRADATAYALDKWVFAAPEGLTVSRGGDLDTLKVSGTSLRASASGLRNPVQKIAVEGDDISVVPSDPSRPFTFDTAKKFEAYLRPNTTSADNADWLIRLTGAHGQPGRFVGNFSPSSPLDIHVEGTLDKMSAFHGVDFATGLKAWKSGGRILALKSELKNTDLTVTAMSDALAVDANSYLAGHLDVEMSGKFKPLDVLAAAGLLSDENMLLAKPLLDMTFATVGAQKLGLDFNDGKAYVGRLKVSDAPIVP